MSVDLVISADRTAEEPGHDKPTSYPSMVPVVSVAYR